MSWEEFNPSDSPGSPEYAQIAIDYWDLVQVRYHMLRALKILQGHDDFILERMKKTREEAALEELEAGHKLNNHLLAEAEHIVEV